MKDGEAALLIPPEPWWNLWWNLRRKALAHLISWLSRIQNAILTIRKHVNYLFLGYLPAFQGRTVTILQIRRSLIPSDLYSQTWISQGVYWKKWSYCNSKWFVLPNVDYSSSILQKWPQSNFKWFVLPNLDQLSCMLKKWSQSNFKWLVLPKRGLPKLYIAKMLLL